MSKYRLYAPEIQPIPALHIDLFERRKDGTFSAPIASSGNYLNCPQGVELTVNNLKGSSDKILESQNDIFGMFVFIVSTWDCSVGPFTVFIWTDTEILVQGLV